MWHISACECGFDFPDCQVHLAYTFACQAVHLRDRLKRYEDTGLMPDDVERLAAREPNAPLTLEELREIALLEWLWVEMIHPTERQRFHNITSAYYQIYTDYTDGEALCCGWPGIIHEFEYEDYGKSWLAYRRKPEEGTV